MSDDQSLVNVELNCLTAREFDVAVSVTAASSVDHRMNHWIPLTAAPTMALIIQSLYRNLTVVFQIFTGQNHFFLRLLKAFCSSLCEHKHYNIHF